ncbi:LexA repressor, partial [Candidatus Peregrinibacteria bacterium]|nr:LexA repressor [Candidatus Peregrinibacteria bacterium]
MLTKKQQRVLDFIEKYQMKNGCSPTIREMR